MNPILSISHNLTTIYLIANPLKYYGIKYTMKLAPIIAVTIKAVIIIPFFVALRLFTG
jgi:hypothetical protein